MANSLELIRVKIAELEAKLTDLRIAERELVALEPELARKTTTPRVSKPKPMRTEKVASPARQTISAAIAEVLNAHGALPAVEIAEYIKAGGREIGKRTISHSLQALKKQGRVRISGGKWMLLNARSKPASA
jgi:ribosomal protein L9